MKRSILLPLTVLLLTSTLAGLYLAQPNPIAQRVTDLERELTAARNEIARLKADRDKLVTSKKPDPSPAPAPAPKPGAQATASATATDATRQMPDTAAKREARYQYQESTIQQQYGRLIKQLGLNDEEAVFFKHLLSDRQTKLTDITIQSGVGKTPAEKEAISRKIRAAKAESDAAIEHFLNNTDDYQAYRQWEDAFLERLQIQQAVTSFDAAGETLSGDQRDRLFDLMLAHRITPDQQTAMRPPGTSPALLSERFQARRTANEQQILQQAATFLTPAQLAVLEEMHQKRRAYSEASRKAQATTP